MVQTTYDLSSEELYCEVDKMLLNKEALEKARRLHQNHKTRWAQGNH